MRRRSPAGFTLIEMLMVITMIAVVAAISLPRIRLEQSQVDTAARTVTSALMAARADAVGRGHNVLVVFDTAGRVLRTVWDANNNLRIDVGEKTRPAPLSEGVSFARGAGVAAFNGATAAFPTLQSVSGMPALVLQRNGALDRAGTLYITSRRGAVGGIVDSRALRLDRATGRATVFINARTGWRQQ
jgi:prepilin-type N-terminal cleavage/methylation domain-containing protein